MLIKQLVMQKKENAKIKEEIEFYERIIEEKEEDEFVDVDRIETASHAFKQQASASKGLGGGRSQLNTRGSVRSGMVGPQSTSGKQQQPIVYFPSKKVETEEEKIKRFERVIEKLKKMLDHERKQLRGARMQYQREMTGKTELEHLLRETVEAVKAERKQKRMTQRSNFELVDANDPNSADLNQQERERVIELLLSQERVIALLYEKTFPMGGGSAGQEQMGEVRIG